MASCQKLGIILVINGFKNWFYQKMSITTNVLLNWYSSMKKKFRKIPMIFDIENWLWKSNFGTFWQPKTFLILYPSFENSTTGNAIIYIDIKIQKSTKCPIFLMIFGSKKSNLKKLLTGGPEIDLFEPIFGFLMQFWF